MKFKQAKKIVNITMILAMIFSVVGPGLGSFVNTASAQEKTKQETPKQEKTKATVVGKNVSLPSAVVEAKDKTVKSKIILPGNKKAKDSLSGKRKYVEGEVIVKYRNNKINLNTSVGRTKASDLNRVKFLEKKEELRKNNISVLKIKDSKTVEDKIAELKSDPNVEYVQPNYQYYPTLVVGDTYEDSLWGLNNSGQLVNGTAGKNDADIDVSEAWAISDATTSTSAIVAVIDTGVAYNHPDLVANMWDGSNCKDENGSVIAKVDDDGSVILSGCNHGYDFEDNDRTPLPTYSSHGTHVAGTIAATKGNGLGIAGVASNAKIMALKSSLTTTDNVKSINFAKQNGASIINASWGGSNNDPALKDAIASFPGLFITAAGNGGSDSVGDNNDGASAHMYPSDFDLDNIISVAATDQNDVLTNFSNYGATSVDVSAPGVNILSAVVDSNLLNETFQDVKVPKLPSGWTAGGSKNNWGTFDVGGDFGNVLYGDLDLSYANNASTTVDSPKYDLSVNGASIDFWTVCDTEYLTDAWGDYMALEVSGDGKTFTELTKWDEALLDFKNGENPISDKGGATYHFSNLNIPSEYLTNKFQFRFRWITNASDNNYEGCLVDDVKLNKFSDGSDEKYAYEHGTSMATPHVAGLAALIEGYNANLTTAQVKNTILKTGDSLASLVGKTVSGSRINAQKALQAVNPAKAIVGFTIPTQVGVTTIDETTHTISVTVPNKTDVKKLTPTITITGASVSPASGVLKDFTNPVIYTVTAADGLTQAYTVTVTVDNDKTPPTVVSSVPVDNTTGTSINITPTLVFSEGLDVSTVKSGNIELRKFDDDSTVSTTLVLSEDDTTVTVKPVVPLQYNKKYYFYVDTGVKDKAGNKIKDTWLKQNKDSHEFLTESVPAVSILSPNGGELFSAGSTTTIKWLNTNYRDSVVNIFLYQSNTIPGANDYNYVAQIGSLTQPNDGEETWTIPSTISPGNNYFIRVNLDVQNPQGGMDTFDDSDAPFSIFAPLDITPPVIKTIPVDMTVEATSPSGAIVTYATPVVTDNVDSNLVAICLPSSGSNFVLGTTVVTCNATDSSGNKATPEIFSVKVQDTTLPTLLLNGENPINIFVGATYIDAGATASDNIDGDITSKIVTVNPVNTAVAGTYIITYNVIDSSGNVATQVIRTVSVSEMVPTPDNTPPVITLNGEAEVTIFVGELYTELGANAIDAVDGKVLVSITTPVDMSSIGDYTITYTAVDAAGNVSSKIRTVHVVPVTIIPDTTAPVITLNKDEGGFITLDLVVGDTFSDPGATAVDAVDGLVAVVVTGSVDTNTIGDYTITYTATDVAGNISTASRIVHVWAAAVPVVLNSIAITTPATKLSYTVGDVLDISGLVITGTYSDASTKVETITTANVTGFNSSEPSIGQVLTVTVGGRSTTYSVKINNLPDTTPPTIALNGLAEITLTIGDSYVEQGIKIVSEEAAGSISVATTGTVDINTVGTYTITYTATDENDNFSTLTRIVHVVAAPIVVIPEPVVTPQSVVTHSSGGGGSVVAQQFVIPAGTVFQAGMAVGTTRNAQNQITLTLNGGANAKRMAISNTADFAGISQEPYTDSKVWTLSEGSEAKTVYVKFYDANGNSSPLLTIAVPSASVSPVAMVLGEKITKLDTLINTLKLNQNSAKVKELQEELKKLGYFSKTFKTTNFYGKLTGDAVKKYLATKQTVEQPVAPVQKILGEKITKLDSLIATLKPNKRNAKVKELQTELKKLGFFPKTFAVTDFYGATTSAGVKKYQASK
ncbi:MAG: immunoglobulin-like domain-containing protein [Candidatus Magasanikbacteria bacterium]